MHYCGASSRVPSISNHAAVTTDSMSFVSLVPAEQTTVNCPHMSPSHSTAGAHISSALSVCLWKCEAIFVCLWKCEAIHLHHAIAKFQQLAVGDPLSRTINQVIAGSH